MKPVIVDTTEFYDEILERVRGSRGPTLAGAAQRKHIRLFAGEHVAVELPAKVAGRFKRRNASPAEGLRLWREEYLPLVHFVDTSELPDEGKALQELEIEDPSDLPNAKLAAILAPVISLSTDKDLTRHEFATPGRWPVARYSDAREQAEGTLLAVSILPRLAFHGVGAGIETAATRWGRLGQAIAISGVAGMLVLGLRRAQKMDPDRRAQLADTLLSILEAVMAVQAEHDRARAVVDQLRVAAPSTRQELVGELACVLAVSPEPPTATGLSQTLWLEESPVPKSFFNTIQDELGRVPAFVRVDRHHWQLGVVRPWQQL